MVLKRTSSPRGYSAVHGLTASVKIDRRLQREESRALLNTGNQMCTYRTCAGVVYTFMAKLGGVVLFVQTHSSTIIKSVNCTCEN